MDVDTLEFKNIILYSSKINSNPICTKQYNHNEQVRLMNKSGCGIMVDLDVDDDELFYTHIDHLFDDVCDDYIKNNRNVIISSLGYDSCSKDNNSFNSNNEQLILHRIGSTFDILRNRLIYIQYKIDNSSFMATKVFQINNYADDLELHITEKEERLHRYYKLKEILNQKKNTSLHWKNWTKKQKTERISKERI